MRAASRRPWHDAQGRRNPDAGPAHPDLQSPDLQSPDLQSPDLHVLAERLATLGR